MCSYMIIWKLEACVGINVEICQNLAYMTLFMYIENEICANEFVSCSLYSYWRIMIISLFVDIHMSMCRGFSSKSHIFGVSRVSFLFTRKIVSLSYTPCAHLT